MNIPVVFVHNNDSFYLDFTLNQAHFTNPKNPIYLIGSNVTKKYAFVNYIDINEFFEDAVKFKVIYKHMSGNGFDFELFCFQRWFIVNEFCKRNNIQNFLYLDSDAMIYCNIDKFFSGLNCKFTISNKIAPHCSYFSSAEVLNDFCDFIVKLYVDPAYTKRFENKYEHHVKNNIPGGVCDMTAFYEYKNDHPGCSKDLAIIENGEVFDDNINASDGFEMENGIKKIEMINGIPYGKLKSGEKVKFNLLHFQGKAKKRIIDFYSGNNLESLKRKLVFEDRVRNRFIGKVVQKFGYKFIS